MVSCSKKILLVLISLIVGMVDYAYGAENRNEKPSFQNYALTNRQISDFLPRDDEKFSQQLVDEDEGSKKLAAIDIISDQISDTPLVRFLKSPTFVVAFEAQFKPEHLVWAIEFDKDEARSYLLYKYPAILESPEKILDSLAVAINDDYKKAFSRIFNDYVKHNRLFINSPTLFIKLFILSAQMGNREAFQYLLHKHPELLESPEKILESLAFANENHYKKAFLRIFNDFVKDKPLFMDSPKLVIKLFILSAQMGDTEAFVYLKNRLEKLKLTPDARNLIYLKAYDGLAGSNPGLAQQFLAEDIAQLGNRLN